MHRERDAGQLEEAFPTDAFDPLAHALVLVGVAGPGFHDIPDRIGHFGPARRVVGQEGDHQARELGRRAGAGNLAAHPDRNAIADGVSQGHARAHGVAVAAVHALVFVDDQRSCVFGSGRMAPVGQAAITFGISHLARTTSWLMFGRLAVDAQDGDIRAVHRAAHIQAASQRDAAVGGQLRVDEVLVQVIHDCLDDARGIRGRGVAVNPALGVHRVADGMPGAANGVVLLPSGMPSSGSTLSSSETRNSRLWRLVKRR